MQIIIEGEVESIETLNRLRPWMESESKKAGFDFEKTKLKIEITIERQILFSY